MSKAKSKNKKWPAMIGAETPEALIETFLNNPKRLKSAEKYRSDLKLFARWLSKTVLGREIDSPAYVAECLITGQHGFAHTIVQRYCVEMQAQHRRHGSTIQRHLSAIRGLILAAKMLNVVTWSLEIRAPKTIQYADVIGASFETIVQMIKLARANVNNYLAARDSAILELMLTNGLRSCEVISLRLCDVDLKQGVLRILRKGATQRTPILIGESFQLLDSLKRWRRERGKSKGKLAFFCSGNARSKGKFEPLTHSGLYYMVKKYSAHPSIEEYVHPHGIRHTAITRAARHCNDIGELQQFSGHKDIRTVMIYWDLAKNASGLASAGISAEIEQALSRS